MAERKRPPLEMGLLSAMQALDAQVQKRIQRRTPAERAVHGVGKFEPLEERVELVAAFLLRELGENNVGLDSLLILARAFPKALAILIDELGLQGLGEERASHCKRAMAEIMADAARAKGVLTQGLTVM